MIAGLESAGLGVKTCYPVIFCPYPEFAVFAFLNCSDVVSGDAKGIRSIVYILLDHSFLWVELDQAFVSSRQPIPSRISDRHNVRLGAGVNYLSVRLDGNALTVEQAQDATVGQYLGSFANMQIIDFNLGLALTHEDYYISYGMHHVNGGRLSSGDDFMNGQPMSIMVQTGYRYSFSESVTGIGNFFYRKQEGFADNTEINLKALMLDTFWVGAGHRLHYANSLHVGYLGGAIRLGYVYEYPINSSRQFLGNTHEFMVMFRFFDQQGQGRIW